ncbi:hypothetical protein BDZ94DRAFT_797145 [Collybia nuda]|uniref:Uncharacterized protein n=1 Tax=Collybia nuda TaxID=64659 RepID=A0A9P5Y1G6_9AGAR|nr:hypothetical protein BDZ94DRAFT_797145 [Collybia nuda]
MYIIRVMHRSPYPHSTRYNLSAMEDEPGRFILDGAHKKAPGTHTHHGGRCNVLLKRYYITVAPPPPPSFIFLSGPAQLIRTIVFIMALITILLKSIVSPSIKAIPTLTALIGGPGDGYTLQRVVVTPRASSLRKKKKTTHLKKPLIGVHRMSSLLTLQQRICDLRVVLSQLCAQAF